MEQAVKGISEACRVLNTPVISGNVSLYNERSGTAIYPTPSVGMVGLIEDLSHITTQVFKNAGDKIYLVGETSAEFGGSELQKLQKAEISGLPPAIDLETEKKNQDLVLTAIKQGLVKSAHDVSEGGLAVALAESLVDCDLGAEIALSIEPLNLFSESQSRFIISVAAEQAAAFESLSGLKPVGQVTDAAKLVIACNNEAVIDIKLAELKRHWKESIPCLLK
jgi:phosphoribosylformylglycinamidine synthase